MKEHDTSGLLNEIRKSERRSTWRMAIAVFICLGLAGLTVNYAFRLKAATNKAQTAESKAERQRVIADSLRIETDSLKADIQESREELIGITDSLSLLLKKCQERLNGNTKEYISVIRKYENTGYLIYLYYESREGSRVVLPLGKQLEEKGYQIVRSSMVGKSMGNSIRYYHDEDAKAAAEVAKIVEIMLKRYLRDNLVKLNVVFDPNQKQPSKKIDIWLGL